jgi:Cu/Ag efflux pump CusA
MGIVRLALRRPYTFIVMGLLIAVLGILSVMTMSTDIFPDINIPCHRSVQNRPVVIDSKPATFIVIRGIEVSWQVAFN